MLLNYFFLLNYTVAVQLLSLKINVLHLKFNSAGLTKGGQCQGVNKMEDHASRSDLLL